MKEILRYLPTALFGITSLSTAYFSLQFILPGAFSINTTAPLISATLIFAGLTIFSLPKLENWFRSTTNLKPLVYWALIAVATTLAVYLIMNGIATGGAEYTQYMAQQS